MTWASDAVVTGAYMLKAAGARLFSVSRNKPGVDPATLRSFEQKVNAFYERGEITYTEYRFLLSLLDEPEFPY